MKLCQCSSGYMLFNMRIVLQVRRKCLVCLETTARKSLDGSIEPAMIYSKVVKQIEPRSCSGFATDEALSRAE